MIDQFIDIYLFKEGWHKNKLPKEEARKYFETMFKRGSSLYETEKGKVIGYIEFWKVSLPQLERIILKDFCVYEEEPSGDICYIANLWIDEEHRNTKTIKLLKNKES